MPPDITTAEIRRRIVKEHGLIPRKHPYFLPDAPPYDESMVDFPKTDLMRYIETKYSIKLKLDIYRGSLNDVCHRYKWEVDRSTVSRWRKVIRRYLIQLEVSK
ncbi:hypothetical protein LCGC14_2511070 [marine sediment metagenome]|uniref:Uncharacterized protein n=1 Tax=marine sediment metagenome TaxID=412755 RepID=A0A0F9DSM1_9ZZZZ